MTTLSLTQTLLVVNTVTEFAAAFSVYFMPKNMSGSDKSEAEVRALWRGGAAVEAFGKTIVSCAMLALGMGSLYEVIGGGSTAITTSKPRPAKSLLLALSTYHLLMLPVSYTSLGFNRLELQYPAYFLHGFLGMGFLNAFLS